MFNPYRPGESQKNIYVLFFLCDVTNHILQEIGDTSSNVTVDA